MWIWTSDGVGENNLQTTLGGFKPEMLHKVQHVCLVTRSPYNVALLINSLFYPLNMPSEPA